MQQDNVSELARRRSNRWMRMLQPPLPLWHNTASREQLIPLGARNLYIGGAGNQVPGYFNVDLVALPGVDVVCDAENLPFRDETLDRVDCEAVIEHTPDPAKLIGEIHRCLKKGGGCRIVAPFCHPFHEYPRDYWRFSIDGLHRLVAPMRVIGDGWFTGPTATLLIVVIEYAKLWMPSRWLKRATWCVLGWLLFPLRYLDVLLLRSPTARQLGNHAYVWAQKQNGE
jgi:SAM-dependent methyltransferase